MRIDRRTLLKTLLGLPIALTLDVEQLLWVPKPIVTVPAYPGLITGQILFSGNLQALNPWRLALITDIDWRDEHWRLA